MRKPAGVPCLRGVLLAAALCSAVCVVAVVDRKSGASSKPVDEKVYLLHADELKYDMYGANPQAQIAKGNVRFMHKGAKLDCDSAYFYELSNSVKAFGRVKFRQGDTLSLNCDRASYDGREEMLESRGNVVLKHRRQTLYADSLNYDRRYRNAYFFEGGKLVDGNDRLVSDWGEYNTETRQAVFYYDVNMSNGKRFITTDTLYYDTAKSTAHIKGPSRITSQGSVIETTDGYFDTRTDKAELYSRSTVVDGAKTITGDSLTHDDKTGVSEGYGNVVYIDMQNKSELDCGRFTYNEKTGEGYATKKALVKDYSQGDTLYMHGDSIKLYSYHLDTDSAYRTVHCFNHVRAYRADFQAVCDSLVFVSSDSCITMYQDPIMWNENRQLLGEVVKVYLNDSTIRLAHIIGQALSVEDVDGKGHYNQVSSSEMEAYFEGGAVRKAVSIGNVVSAYYPIDGKDSTMIGLNRTESDTMKMYLSPARKMERIWMPKAEGTLYPMTQIPPGKMKLEQFAWFEDIRPKDKDDVFVWRGKGDDAKLRIVERQAAPLQHLGREEGGETETGRL